jgi:hypothetical protein
MRAKRVSALRLNEFGGKMLGFRRYGKALRKTWSVMPRAAGLPKLQRLTLAQARAGI